MAAYPPLRLVSLYTFCLFLTLVLTCQAAQSFTPAAVPLAVRSPYLLSSLQTQSSGPEHSRTWPNSFAQTIVGWAGLARVDGVVYVWLGDADSIANTTTVVKLNQTLTPTQTIFLLKAGPVDLTVSFLSPIEPGDLVKQSIPFSYVALEMRSNDGQPHSVQVYSDITGEWVTGDRSQNIAWNFQKLGSSMYHTVYAALQKPYNEFGGQATWGNTYYATQQGLGCTYMADSDLRTRQLFIANGALDNSFNQTFRGIGNDFPTFAFAKNLGNMQSTTEPVVWAIGLTRDNGTTGAVQYRDLSGSSQTRSLYYVSKYTDDGTLINDFLSDYSAALGRATQLDNQLLSASSALGGDDYADLVSLAARQAYTGMELTVAKDADGNVNASDVMMFMKDLGFPDNGVNNAMSPVDGLFSAFPAFMAIDPSLGGYILEPLLRFQNDARYTNEYAAQNLGLSYPNAAGSTSAHSQGLEQSANMILLSYGYAKASGNKSQASQYYNLLKTWADYCASSALNMDGQTSSDGLDLPRQTNLALKGIIAVKAMAGISNITGHSADANVLSAQAHQLYNVWLKQALAEDGHMLLSSRNVASSWSSGYNMFADLWLETGLLDTSAVDAQVNFIQTQLASFGLPTDSSNSTIATSYWNMFVAAISARNASAQRAVISAVHARASKSDVQKAGLFPAEYDPTQGTEINGLSNPRQGAILGALLVNASTIPVGNSVAASTSTGAGSQGAPSSSGHLNVGAIVGGVIGALLVTGGAIAIFFVRRCHLRQHRFAVRAEPQFEPAAEDTTVSPFITAAPPLSEKGQLAAAMFNSEAGPRVEQDRMTDEQSSVSAVTLDATQLINDLRGLRREMMLMRTEQGDLPPSYSPEIV